MESIEYENILRLSAIPFIVLRGFLLHATSVAFEVYTVAPCGFLRSMHL